MEGLFYADQVVREGEGFKGRVADCGMVGGGAIRMILAGKSTGRTLVIPKTKATG